MHEFVQNSKTVFSPRAARLVIFSLCAALISDFQQSAELWKTAFSARDQHVLSFSHRAHPFLEFTAKCTSLYKTAFSERDQHVLSFWHWVHHFLAISCKVHEFVQNSVFSPSWARFFIFALITPLFSDFQQSTSICPNQRFQPEISAYCHFCTGCTTFSVFSAKCTSLYKTAFWERD